ncbi:MAG TPA: hypothetical protein VJB34_07200 [Bdellovibrionota bacterium]|nr:hypothetical protein [Bdellovibrionota bacterium]
MRPAVIFVERGWGGCKEYAKELVIKEYSPGLIIKGKLEQNILALIRKDPRITIIDVREFLFKIFIFFKIMQLNCNQKGLVVVTKEKTAAWLKFFKKYKDFELQLLNEKTQNGKIVYQTQDII